MIQTVSQTYTQDDAQKRIEAARAMARERTGVDNPEAVRAALATSTFDNDEQLKTAQAGQQSNITALQELSNFDTELAGKYSQANKAQLATDNARRAATTAMGAVNGNNAAATIASGPSTFNTADYAITGPTMLNPFVAAGITEGQSNAIQGEFSLADMARSARERYLGSEVTQLTEMYKAQKEEEARKAEEERQTKLRQFELDMNYAKTNGGVVVDPETGKEYKFDSPEEKARKEQAIKAAAEQSVLQKPGRSGKTLAEEVTDGMGSFIDVIRENPALSKDEAMALARLNVQKFGGFKESPEELQNLGLGFIAEDPSLLSSGAGGVNGDVALETVISQGGSDLLDGSDQAMRQAQAKAIIAAGGVEAYKSKQSKSNDPYEGYDVDNATRRKAAEYQAYITRLKQVKTDLEGAMGGAESGKFRDLGIGVTGFLSQFAGTGGQDKASKVRQALEQLRADVRNKTFGAALTDNEIKEAEKILPGMGVQEGSNLNRITNEIAKKENELNSLLGQFGVPNAAPLTGGLVTMQAPDGMTYQVAPDEVNEAANNGWRKL